MSVLQRLITRARFNRKYSRHPGVLRLTQEGLQIERYCLRDTAVVLETVLNFKWLEVQRIFGFKRDLYTVDIICIAFELRDTTVEINEEMDGYRAVIATFPKHFPGLEAEWWAKVAFPAFATNWTTIWETSRVCP